MAEQLSRTPLFDRHVARDARMVDFGGWEMPVQYSGIKDEHLAVRQNAGIFDISHMGEFLVTGEDAGSFLNSILTNDVSQLSPGTGQYTLSCQENGGVVDDLYLYCLHKNFYLLIVNASRLEADWSWISKQKEKLAPGKQIALENKSSQMGAIAVQGPSVSSWIDACFEIKDSTCKVSELIKNQIGTYHFNGKQVWIGATGYTGEEGVEIIAENQLLPEIWDLLLAKGHVGCVQPAGLGARDTLRTEMGYPLYGHELTTETTPLEAGLSYFVDLEGDDFVGKQALMDQKTVGLKKKCIAFQMKGRSAPPRPEYKVLSDDGTQIGMVTSGTSSPSLNNGIGMAYVDINHAKIGNGINIEIRGRTFPAEIVKKPIYRKQ
jgi:aminomethyltransferase